MLPVGLGRSGEVICGCICWLGAGEFRANGLVPVLWVCKGCCACCCNCSCSRTGWRAGDENGLVPALNCGLCGETCFANGLVGWRARGAAGVVEPNAD